MSRSEILLQSVQNFYQEPKNSEALSNILDKKGGVSLRNLEWFVTNYSKNKNITYTTGDGKNFAVHVSYKSTLDGYSKKLFDPFCRTDKVSFMLSHNQKSIDTTVAQLNFIRWCIKNNVIEYFKENQNILKKNYN
jgi:hypothetical protein